MAFLNDEIKTQLTEHFTGLKKTVNILLFVDDCNSCADAKGLIGEVAELSDKITFTVHDLTTPQAKAFNVERTPVIAFADADGNDMRVRFNGVPGGHEFSAFITTINEIGEGSEELPRELADKILAIDKAVDIKVFVTLACPHCSGAVAKAHKLALMNKNIRSQMIECGTFPELADKYDVSGVPKIVINEKQELIGNQPIDQFLDAIDKL